jgi:hypothetical protein
LDVVPISGSVNASSRRPLIVRFVLDITPASSGAAEPATG